MTQAQRDTEEATILRPGWYRGRLVSKEKFVSSKGVVLRKLKFILDGFEQRAFWYATVNVAKDFIGGEIYDVKVGINEYWNKGHKCYINTFCAHQFNPTITDRRN